MPHHCDVSRHALLCSHWSSAFHATGHATREVVEPLRMSKMTIAPHNTMLTTQEAADLLNISRPTMVRLLTAGAGRDGSRRRRGRVVRGNRDATTHEMRHRGLPCIPRHVRALPRRALPRLPLVRHIGAYSSGSRVHDSFCVVPATSWRRYPPHIVGGCPASPVASGLTEHLQNDASGSIMMLWHRSPSATFRMRRGTSWRHVLLGPVVRYRSTFACNWLS